MAKLRRVLRKVGNREASGIDTQFWPVVVALCVMTSFLVGAVLTLLHGIALWVCLMLIPAGLAAAIIVLASVSHRRLRRSLQLAMILSLIIHIMFVLSAYRFEVFGRWQSVQKGETQARVQRTIAMPVEIEQQQPWEQVNVTETPEQEVQPERTEQQQQEVPEREPTPTEPTQEQAVRPVPVERQQQSESNPRFAEQSSQRSRSQQNVEAQTSTTADASEAAAAAASSATAQTQSSSSAQAARSENSSASAQRPNSETQPNRTSEQVASSSPTRRSETNPDQPSPNTTRTERSRANPQITINGQVELTAEAQVQTPTRTETQTPQPSSQVAQSEAADTSTPRVRRQTNNTTPQRTERTNSPLERQTEIAQTNQPRSTPEPRQTIQPSAPEIPNATSNSPSRRANQIAQTQPTTEVNVAEAASSSSRQSVSQPTEQALAMQRRSNSQSNASRRQTNVETNQSMANRSRIERSEQATQLPNASDASAVAQSNSPSANRRADPNATPTTSTQVAQATNATAPESATQVAVNPSSSELTRQPTRSENATRQQNAMAEAQTGLTAQIPRPQANANPNSTQPSITTNQSSARPRRTISENSLAQSPTQVESPSESRANQGESVAANAPQQFALERADSGITGRAGGRNVSRDDAAGEHPAVSPSNSMARSEATSSEPGQAFQPSQSARVRQSLSGDAMPGSSLAVSSESTSGMSASTEATAIASSSSASSIDSRSSDARGDVSAMRGSADIDIGAPKIVANSGAERGGGGGQPSPVNSAAPTEANADARGALQASIASNQTADVPASPLNEGNTGPLEARENPLANSLARSEAGDAADVSGGPTRAATEGPSELRTQASEVGSASLARSESADAIPDASMAGGGDEDDEDEERERLRQLARSGGTPGTGLTVELDLPASGSTRGSAEASATQLADNGSETQASRSETRTESGSGATRQTSDSVGELAGGMSGANSIELSRAENTSGLDGQPEPGGGTRSSNRRTPSVSIGGPTEVDSLASGSPSRGSSDSVESLEANEIGGEKLSGRVESLARTTLGAMAGQMIGPSIAALPPVVLNPGTGSAESSTEADADMATGTGERGRVQTQVGPGTGTSVAVDLDMGTGETGSDPNGSATSGAGSPGELTPSQIANMQRRRRSGGGSDVRINADEGPGGLGPKLTPRVGIDDRRARRDEGLVQQLATSRFRRDAIGGQPSTSSAVVIPTDAFEGRQPPGGRTGSPETEESIELGLAFLARHQMPDGSWKLETFGTGLGDKDDETPVYQSDAAATGLAVLAFQGAGYNHLEYKYASQLTASIGWLVDHQDEDGCLYVADDAESNKYCRLYSHAIAALALSEAYGMTQDPRLKEPAQKALNYISASQDSTRGGWRYTPGRSADTSVSGWMMMALKSGQLAGLDVPAQTYRGIRNWVNIAEVPNSPHQFRYNPYADTSPERRHGREASRSMTAVGTLMKLYLGGSRQDENVSLAAEYILEQLPSDADAKVRDTYYWYYATQVMRHVGGEQWERWNNELHPLLLRTQITQPRRFRPSNGQGLGAEQEDFTMVGSWDPLHPVPDAWGITGGRIYVTTLNLLSLEVDYRLLPLYDDTAK